MKGNKRYITIIEFVSYKERKQLYEGYVIAMRIMNL